MINFFGFFILSVLPALCSSRAVSSVEGPERVVFVSVLFRHGDRTPITSYPKDPYKDSSLWSEGLGQLTNAGKLRHYELGKWLRSHYCHLIGDKFSKDKVYIESTDETRCLMSALSNMAGLFPPSPEETWGPIPWQPIPVRTMPNNMNKVLMEAECPRYDLEYEKSLHSHGIKTLKAKYQHLMKLASKNLGVKIKEMADLEQVYATLYIEADNNLTLPAWTKSVYPEPLKYASALGFGTHTNNDLLKRLKAGPFLKEILKHMKEKAEGTLSPDRNMWIYSAHDSTIVKILDTLSMYNNIPPPYAAAVLFELRYSPNDGHSVNILYKNSTGHPYELHIPKCGVSCPLDKFAKLYERFVPKNWEKECEIKE